MTAMDDTAIKHIYEIYDNVETLTFSRDMTEEELARYSELRQSYLQGNAMPKEELKVLAENESYLKDGIALREETCTIFLPDRELTEEELLQIVDFNEKIIYSSREVHQFGYGTKWRERMEQMTREEIDAFYFINCSTKNATSHSYNRLLSQTERQRYQELLTEYEENGRYTETEPVVVIYLADVTGTEFTFCIQDADYYFPDRELTEEELLALIEWEHKSRYCTDRIHKEVLMGIREDFPVTPYDLPRTETDGIH